MNVYGAILASLPNSEVHYREKQKFAREFNPLQPDSWDQTDTLLQKSELWELFWHNPEKKSLERATEKATGLLATVSFNDIREKFSTIEEPDLIKKQIKFCIEKIENCYHYRTPLLQFRIDFHLILNQFFSLLLALPNSHQIHLDETAIYCETILDLKMYIALPLYSIANDINNNDSPWNYFPWFMMNLLQLIFTLPQNNAESIIKSFSKDSKIIDAINSFHVSRHSALPSINITTSINPEKLTGFLNTSSDYRDVRTVISSICELTDDEKNTIFPKLIERIKQQPFF